MDASTIQRLVNQAWAVNELGDNVSLIQETVSHGCSACGMSLGPDWVTVLTHLRQRHTPEGIAAANGSPNDGTSVGTYHAVELEPPNVD